MQERQLTKLGLVQVRQFGPQGVQILESASNDHPLPQFVQKPVEQSIHPGGHNLTYPDAVIVAETADEGLLLLLIKACWMET